MSIDDATIEFRGEEGSPQTLVEVIGGLQVPKDSAGQRTLVDPPAPALSAHTCV